jgi:serine/threonine-protein kinase HipA
MINVKRLTVIYNKEVVGFLESLNDERIAFQYAKHWVEHGFSISPLSLPLSDQVFISKSKHFNGLFGVFQHSLPDGWGELLMRRMLSKQGVNFDKLSPLTKLSLIRHNGLGALEYEPTQQTFDDISMTDLDQISCEVQAIFKHHDDTKTLDKIYAIGGASGGARPKVHVVIDDLEWIVKFPHSLDPKDIGLLEYEANQKALKAGIRVNEHALFPSQRYKGFFAAKRFDRQHNKKVHVISLSALLETSHTIPNLDYTHLFQVIQKICIDQSDMIEAYKRMCFNVLYHNRDDHGKNIAFLYDESKGGYTLTPCYDITKTPDKVEHEMTVLGNGKPTEKELIDMAKAFKLSMKTCLDIIENIKHMIKE